MTKFNKFANSPLTEVFTKQDWNYFNSAYGVGVKDPTLAVEKDKKGRARKWIMDVFEVFAMKLDLDVGQAKFVFERFSADGLKRIYARRLPILREQMQKLVQAKTTRTTEFEALEERIKMMVKLSEMDNQDLINAVRAEWTRALSLPHPAFDRHLISGKSQVRQDAKSEVKVQGKRGTTPIVESKRPHAVKAA